MVVLEPVVLDYSVVVNGYTSFCFASEEQLTMNPFKCFPSATSEKKIVFVTRHFIYYNYIKT